MSAQQLEVIHEGSQDSLHGPKHGAEAQVEQHEEEERGPQWAGWEQGYGLSEGYERQSRPFYSLDNKQTVCTPIEDSVEPIQLIYTHIWKIILRWVWILNF